MSIFSLVLVGRNVDGYSSIRPSLIEMPEIVQTSALQEWLWLQPDYEEDLHIAIYTVRI